MSDRLEEILKNHCNYHAGFHKDKLSTPEVKQLIESYIDSKVIEAEKQGALNALTQLKADRIEHVLTTKSDEGLLIMGYQWTREIDFIDEHILALNHRKDD